MAGCETSPALGIAVKPWISNFKAPKSPKMLSPPSLPSPQARPLVTEEEIKGIRQSALLGGVRVSRLKGNLVIAW